MTIVILGAGPTGLGAAWRLNELGHEDWVILEASGGPGGLASSSVDDKGFTWDVGVHALHNHFPYFKDVMDKTEIDFYLHQRNAQAYMRGGWVPYPVQYNVHRLPTQERLRVVMNMLGAGGRVHRDNVPDNFGAWLAWCFGDALYESFLKPYNEKVWATPLDRMSLSWMGERVPSVDIERVITNLCLDKDDVSWGPNSGFAYPAGGSGALWVEVADMLPRQIKYGVKAMQVNLRNKYVQSTDGHCHKYEQLISTAPLDWLHNVSLEPGDFQPLKTEGLRHTTTHVIGIGLEGECAPDLNDKNWIYFPEEQFPFYRAAILSGYAPGMAPDGHWSIMMECAESDWKTQPAKNDLIADCVRALHESRLIDQKKVVTTHYQREGYGYPVPTLGRDAAVKELEDYFVPHEVYSRGRFGHWKYEVSNQDHSFIQGVEVVDRILNGTPETVVKF